MADLLTFPTLPLIVHGRPRPFFSTDVQQAPSGAEFRVGRPAVRYRFPLEIMLRPALGEDVTFFGFFESVGGMRDSFLYPYTDPVSGTVTTYRVRFDTDSLDDLDYDSGSYSGSIDLVSVVT